jgi:hypothetical protein
MEELFRFSVLRPADRSEPQTLDLQRPVAAGNYIAPPPLTFGQTLQQAAASAAQLPLNAAVGNNNDAIWSKLLDAAKSFLGASRNYAEINQACTPNAFLQNQTTTPVNFSSLDSFSEQWQALTADKLPPVYWPGGSQFKSADVWPADAKSVAQSYWTYWNANPANRNPATLLNWKYDLGDIFLALLILRANGPLPINSWVAANPVLWTSMAFFTDSPTLREIGDALRSIGLLLTDPATLKTVGDVQAVLNQTILIPPGIFTAIQKPVHPIGIREFHVVKQHIRGYQLGEIAKIENILKGESRDHTTKHTLSNETDTFNQTVTTTETDKEMDDTDQVDIKNESDSQVKEDTKIDGGVHATYDSGTFKLQADVTASYNKSSDNTQKFASDVSQSVTKKAVNNVTTQVTQSQTTKIIETWEEDEDQSFNNTAGKDNVSGIYQWVEKVYLAQTFNLGRHLIFDIMVPEPGASLVAMATIPPPNLIVPIPPDPLLADDTTGWPVSPAPAGSNPANPPVPLRPDHLKDLATVNRWIAKYQVSGVSQPPASSLTFAKAIAVAPNPNVVQSDVIDLDDGYSATSASVTCAWEEAEDDDKQSVVDVQVGNVDFMFAVATNSNTRRNINRDYTDYGLDVAMQNEQGNVPISVKSIYTNTVSVNIEVNCKCTEDLLNKWRLDTYGKIVSAWQTLQSNYNTQAAAMQLQQGTVGPLGAADPDANRLTERLELKRSCIAIMDNQNETVRGVRNYGVTIYPPPAQPPKPQDPQNPALPEPILPPGTDLAGDSTETLGARVRWFEQAFEWENMAYISYPYFWGRRSQWV